MENCFWNLGTPGIEWIKMNQMEIFLIHLIQIIHVINFMN